MYARSYLKTKSAGSDHHQFLITAVYSDSIFYYCICIAVQSTISVINQEFKFLVIFKKRSNKQNVSL